MSEKLSPQDVSEYVSELFSEKYKDFLVYHNLEHTEQVVLRATEIAAYYDLTDVQFLALYTAAWFHDTGHLLNVMEGHEEAGISLLKHFLEEKDMDPVFIKLCSDCILSTKMPVKPVTLIEKILCDADTYHVGTTDFWRIDKLVWDEFGIRLNQRIDYRIERSLSFLEKHVFFTEYCQTILSNGKNNNIGLLRKKIEAANGR